MRREDLIQGFRQVLEQMKTVSHVGGLGRALASPSAYAVDRSHAITFSDGIARTVQQEHRFRRPRNQGCLGKLIEKATSAGVQDWLRAAELVEVKRR
jgi:hypothetical protein